MLKNRRSESKYSVFALTRIATRNKTMDFINKQQPQRVEAKENVVIRPFPLNSVISRLLIIRG